MSGRTNGASIKAGRVNAQGSTTHYRTQRQIAIRRDGMRCRWCGDPVHHRCTPQWCDLCLNTDHLIKRPGMPGADMASNLIVSCYWCNQSRGSNDRPEPKPTTSHHPMSAAVLAW